MDRIKIADGGTPAPIVVYYIQRPYPDGGLNKTVAGRVGMAESENEIPALIADDKRRMGETFGGLFAPFKGQSHRSYRAFRAAWTPIDC